MRLAVFEQALGAFREELQDFEPALVTTSDAARALEVFSALERTVVAAKTLVAARAAESNRWRDEGHRSPASWLAATTGSGFGEASAVIETSERIASLPETSGALRRGELSGPQMREIAATAAENPAAENRLLEVARTSGLRGLRDECRRVKARAVSEAEARARYEQIRRTRFLRMWTDPDGAGRIEARVTPDALARLAAAIGRESSAVFDEARRAGRREPRAAYDADALVALVTGPARTGSRGGGGTGATKTVMHLRVDLAALRRGTLEEGESCEIPGVGPVALATAVNELGDALLKVVISDGVDVTTVCHVGRAVPATIRSALEDRDEVCVVPGCDVARGLEIDHYRIGFAQDGPTELWNLCRICPWHHYLKTHGGYVLTGGPGTWEWEAPAAENNPVLTS